MGGCKNFYDLPLNTLIEPIDIVPCIVFEIRLGFAKVWSPKINLFKYSFLLKLQHLSGGTWHIILTAKYRQLASHNNENKHVNGF